MSNIHLLLAETRMPFQFSHDEPATPESAQRARQLLEDQQWYADHSQELHARFAGLFVAVAGGEPFAAATREAAYELAKRGKPAAALPGAHASGAKCPGLAR